MENLSTEIIIAAHPAMISARWYSFHHALNNTDNSCPVQLV